MKKLQLLMLSLMMMVSLAACGSGKEEPAAETAETADTPETITINSLDGSGEQTELEVPYDPQRIAVMDLADLDILDNLGYGDRVVGVSKGSSIEYLQDYVTDDTIINLGTIKEADLEAVMECEPDVIFIGGRLSSQYDALSEIAPVIYLSTDSEVGVIESTSKNATIIASLFGKEETVAGIMANFDERVQALKEVSDGQTAMIGMVTSGSFNILGNDGRCSIIGVEIGFENLGLEAAAENERGGGKGGDSTGGDNSPHGEEASFELLLSINPNYIFVMDRDAAIGTDGAQLAQEVMENELVMQTEAYQNENIVHLEHPAVWYTAEGGISALDTMLGDLESVLLK